MVTSISFTKMQGAGNDFVVIDNRSQQLSKQDIINLTPKICARKYGVGSDGLLALLPPAVENSDYTMFFRNPDGSDAGMCGNGGRCIALFAHSLGFDPKHHFSVHGQRYRAEVKNSGDIGISFPITASVKEMTINDQKLYAINTGTEHVVMPVDENKLQNEKHLYKTGQHLRYHQQFKPQGTNVNFICGLNKSTVKLQTYERGVEDLTLACGTGAIASALIWHYMQNTKEVSGTYEVETKGGTLKVYYTYDPESKHYKNIKLEGPAHFVFEGTYKR
jgi:diaminopimelate epimerase